MYTDKTAVSNTDESFLDVRTTELLLKLGIPASNRGYLYLRFAIMHTYKEPESAIYVTKTLYPLVARTCRATNAQSVERTCHHAIRRAYDGGFREDFISILGIAAVKCPTCSEFIRAAADYLHSLDGTEGL